MTPPIIRKPLEHKNHGQCIFFAFNFIYFLPPPKKKTHQQTHKQKLPAGYVASQLQRELTRRLLLSALRPSLRVSEAALGALALPPRLGSTSVETWPKKSEGAKGGGWQIGLRCRGGFQPGDKRLSAKVSFLWVCVCACACVCERQAMDG